VRCTELPKAPQSVIFNQACVITGPDLHLQQEIEYSDMRPRSIVKVDDERAMIRQPQLVMYSSSCYAAAKRKNRIYLLREYY